MNASVSGFYQPHEFYLLYERNSNLSANDSQAHLKYLHKTSRNTDQIAAEHNGLKR